MSDRLPPRLSTSISHGRLDGIGWRVANDKLERFNNYRFILESVAIGDKYQGCLAYIRTDPASCDSLVDASIVVILNDVSSL